MICKQCGIVLPWDGAKEITNCTICRKPFSTTADDVFRDGKFGICKEKRDGQHRLALDIEHAIEYQETLLAEGGTGIGKSYGYLVPGILAGKRMVIATAKKTLQGQLYDKDLPMLREKMPYVATSFDDDTDGDTESIDAETDMKFNFINIKGKANYLCPDLVSEVLKKNLYNKEKNAALLLRLSAIIHGVKYGGMHTWVERADFPELSDLFADISTENCPNMGCKFACRPRARNYNIIVTNHHVLAYQLRYGERILGKFDVLVVDEAHHFEEAIRSAFTDTVSVNYFKKSMRILREDHDLEGMIEDLGGTSSTNLLTGIRELQDGITSLAAYARDYMDSASKVIDQDKLREIAASMMESYSERITSINGNFDNTVYKMSNVQTGEYTQAHIFLGVSKLKKICTKIQALGNLVNQIRTPDPEKQFVLLYEERNGDAFLIRTPIEVGPLVQGALEKIPTKTFVSATLAVNKKFDYFKKRIGLDLPPVSVMVRKHYTAVITTALNVPKHLLSPENEQEDKPLPTVDKFYESPFDYKRQARLYTPRYTYNTPIPNPSDQANRENWLKAISSEILRLCRYADGDAFVLFTAKTDLRDVKMITEDHFKSYGLNLLTQQDEGAEALLEEYRNTPKSVLFGLKSFWEGIDVVGEKLRLVIIPKLPFPNQSDAVIKEMVKRAGKSWFHDVYVPKMIFDLRQGTGRLIRSMTDKGVIAILDTRIWTATSNPEAHATNWEKLERKVASNRPYGPVGYGKMIVNSLGFENVVDNFYTAVNFLNEPLTSVNGS
jgi:ATP-dependent DNA helicase DinG